VTEIVIHGPSFWLGFVAAPIVILATVPMIIIINMAIQKFPHG
jgi:hypothetical protein